jgi:serine/threonine protein kinase
MLIGTPTFMSPEQAAGKEDLTPATDQYSLGICLYHMVTARVPFDARTALAVVQMQISEIPPDPRALRPDLPDLAARVIDRMLAKGPGDRFENCMAAGLAFENALEGSGLARLRAGRIPNALRSRIDSALASVQSEQMERDEPEAESAEGDDPESQPE